MELDIQVAEPQWSGDPKDRQWMEGGYAIPRSFTVRAEAYFAPAEPPPVGRWVYDEDPTWTAEVQVEISEGKARTRSLTITTDTPGGVTSTTLRQVPIRVIVVEGVLRALRRTEEDEDGTMRLAPLTLPEAKEAYALVERIVGYVEVKP